LPRRKCEAFSFGARLRENGFAPLESAGALNPALSEKVTGLYSSQPQGAGLSNGTKLWYKEKVEPQFTIFITSNEKIMSKKIIIISLLFVGLLFAQAPVKAQTQDPLPELPGPGLTPNSPLYFLERAAEAIGEFLTFNTEAKAKLQAKRALERIAEVKAMLAEKEVNPKGLNVAIDRLQANVAKAAEIVQKEQQKGKDVSKLAKELDTDFEVRKRLLKRVLEEKEDQIELAFKEQKLELKKQLLEAKAAGDAQKVGEIVLALDKLEQEKEAQEFLLEQWEEELELALEIEEEKFELAMEAKEQELELKEKEAELAFEKKKRELERQFEEAKLALELKEKALENQFDVALALGDSQDIESIEAQLLAIGGEVSSLDSKFDESERALDEVERNFEFLLLKEERGLEDFVRQEELALKKAEFEMERAFKEKELALESQFRAKEGELEIKEKQLKIQILEARQACQQAADPVACLTEKVGPLQEKLAQVKIQKEELELEKEKAEKALELEEERMEQEIELKEKELELREEERERAIELKEEEFERLKEERERQLE
jgi:hypothetical protein